MAPQAARVFSPYAWAEVGYVVGALVVGAALFGGVVGLAGDVFDGVALGVGLETTLSPPQADAANRIASSAAAAARRRCMRAPLLGEDRAGSVGGAPNRPLTESRTRQTARFRWPASTR